MREVRERRFTWLEGLILAVFVVLALAVAVFHHLVTSGWRLTYYTGSSVPWPSLPWWFQALHGPAKRVQSDFVAFLGIVSIGVALVLFRRPPWRIPSLPTPGGSAAAAAVATMLWGKVLILLRTSDGPRRVTRAIQGMGISEAEFLPNAESVQVAGAVMGVWVYLLLARAWKARDDWRDWLGRWLGWAWISAAALRALLFGLWG